MVKGQYRPHVEHMSMTMIGLLVLSNCAEDNQHIPNNIPSHGEEDIQRENINALTKKLVVHVSQKFSWRGFHHSLQNVNKNLWVYTGGKCVAIAKVFEMQSGGTMN
jgi:hypothetical protein